MNIADNFIVNPATMDLYDGPISEIKSKINDAIFQMRLDRGNEFIAQLSITVGYQVNKDELVKALMYDRKQYKKGFHDAEEHFRAVATWEYNEYADEDSEFQYKCGRCGCPERSNNHRFCSSCGARMKPKKY